MTRSHRTLRTTLIGMSIPFALAVMIPPAPGHAQARNPEADANVARARAAMAPLAGLVGKWTGDADVTIGRGQKRRIAQSEDIVWGAGETVILVRGTGRSTEAADEGTIVFEAAAVLWFDPDQGRVRMKTHRDGDSVEPEIEIKPDTLVWSFEVPGGRVRYVIAIDGDRWHETGHSVRAGAPAVDMIDMRLRRVSP